MVRSDAASSLHAGRERQNRREPSQQSERMASDEVGHARQYSADSALLDAVGEREPAAQLSGGLDWSFPVERHQRC